MEHRFAIPDHRRAFGFAQTATHFYVFGGVSNGTRVPDVNRLDLATGMWQSRAAMPFTSEAPTCALMASTGIVSCTEGDTGSGFASYNIATNSWTPLASIPGGDHFGSASGAFNGKVFVARRAGPAVNNGSSIRCRGEHVVGSNSGARWLFCWQAISRWVSSCT